MAKWRTVRDAILVVVGVVGLMHREFFAACEPQTPERDKLLLAYFAMLGLAAFFQAGKGGRP